jgi:hypothetical protein
MATADTLFKDAMHENKAASERRVRSDYYVPVPSQPAQWGKGSFEARLQAFQEDAEQVYERLSSFSPNKKSLKLAPRDPLKEGLKEGAGAARGTSPAPRKEAIPSPGTAANVCAAGTADAGGGYRSKIEAMPLGSIGRPKESMRCLLLLPASWGFVALPRTGQYDAHLDSLGVRCRVNQFVRASVCVLLATLLRRSSASSNYDSVLTLSERVCVYASSL